MSSNDITETTCAAIAKAIQFSIKFVQEKLKLGQGGGGGDLVMLSRHFMQLQHRVDLLVYYLVGF
jgi:hypothetical protein